MSSDPIATTIASLLTGLQISTAISKVSSYSESDATNSDQDTPETGIQERSPQPLKSQPPKRETFRDHFLNLPSEIRCLIYDFLVAGRTIDVLQRTWLRFVDTDSIEQICKFEKSLQEEISKWLKMRKDLTVSAEMGIFHRNTTFLLDFERLPPSRHPIMDPLPVREIRWREYCVWNEFAHSEFSIKHVRHIQVNLQRLQIFTDKRILDNVRDCEHYLQADLRYLKNFKNLERIDFELDTVRFWKDIHELDGYPRECLSIGLANSNLFWTQWSMVLFRVLWQAFWNYCGWCHPALACTCCVLPEIRFKDPSFKDGKLVVLGFEEKEERWRTEMQRIAEPWFRSSAAPGRHRLWLTNQVKEILEAYESD
jgi:hypothetical protein